MGAKIDFHYWAKKYEDDYSVDIKSRYPAYLDENGIEHQERSPYFEKMSKVVQKRGHLLWKEFVSIGRWKAERQRGRYENNSDEEVEDATKEAFQASERDKLKILCILEGVQIPVASAILTMVYPENYCVIDYRAWRAFLCLYRFPKKESFTFTTYNEYSDFLDLYGKYGRIDAYLLFLKTLRNEGKRRNMTSRQVEIALWKFDKMRGQKSNG